MSKISYLNEYQQQAPTIENRKVLPTPPKYNQVREREYLTQDEIERISKAAMSVGRRGHHDCLPSRITCVGVGQFEMVGG